MVHKCINTVLGCAVVCFLLVIYMGIFQAENAWTVFRILSDGFFVVSVLAMGIGFLSAISAIGFFNIFGYSGRYMLSLFRRNMDSGPRLGSYYDYRESQKDTKKAKWHLVIGGGFYFAASLIFLAIENHLFDYSLIYPRLPS